MNAIDKLAELFGKFPGIGPRQAKRFVYFLLTRNGDYSGDLIRAIQELKKEIIQCYSCMRFFVYPEQSREAQVCSICADDTRDSSMLMIVPRDIDLESVEKSGSYHGHYFVIGGVVTVLEKDPEKRIRINDLQKIISKRKSDLKEIILAMNANIDGENTAEYLKNHIKNYTGNSCVITVLGRGLSTGAELEYADPETLKNAFLHRTK